MKQEKVFVVNSMDVCIEGDCFMMKLDTGKKKLRADDFHYCMYADDYFLMGNDSGDNAAKVHGETIEVAIHSRHLWLPGNYKLIFEFSECILGTMDFMVDEEQGVEFCGMKPVGSFTPEDVALSLLASDSYWKILASYPGAKELRKEAIEKNRLKLWRTALHLDISNEVIQPSGYIFTCKGHEKPDTVIRSFYMALDHNAPLEIVDSTTLYDAGLQNPLDGLNRLFNETEHGSTICLGKVGALAGTGGRFVIKKLTEALVQGKYGLWLYGTQQELDALFNVYPSLSRFFPEEKRLSLLPFTGQEMIRCFFHLLQGWDLHPNAETSQQMLSAIQQGYDDGTIANWTIADINLFYQEKVMPAYLKRVVNTATSFSKDELRTEDIDFSLLYGHSSGYEDCLKELNQMVGLDNVKKSVATIAHQVKIFADRRRLGLATNGKEVFHSIFTGCPGTGKTTVAKMLGKIYHHLGVLSKGEVITVDRSRLVGRFIGDTEDNVKNLLKEAQGNVLFVDEAYTLYGSEGSNDYGRRAIECLLTSLSEHNPDMLVIFAGYKDEMDKLMTMNPGLYDRFPYKFHFADYSAEQLIQIAENLLAKDDYLLTPEARGELRDSIGKVVRNRSSHFGNARWVEQFVRNGIIPALADRLVGIKALRQLKREDYQRVEASDIQSAYEQFAPNTVELKPRLRVVGFGS